MGKTFKDESIGADGKFRSRQRSHARRTAGGKQKQPEEVSSDAYEFEEKDIPETKEFK